MKSKDRFRSDPEPCAELDSVLFQDRNDRQCYCHPELVSGSIQRMTVRIAIKFFLKTVFIQFL